MTNKIFHHDGLENDPAAVGSAATFGSTVGHEPSLSFDDDYFQAKCGRVQKDGRLIDAQLRSASMRSLAYKSLQNYTARKKESGQPVSPHVTIYAFPIGALSSITNRVTGCVLSMGCAGLGAAELIGGSGSALSLMQMIGSQGMLITAAAKFTVAFPLTYHYLGGLRHLVWDATPDLLTNADVEKHSYWLFGGSTAISALLMFA